MPALTLTNTDQLRNLPVIEMLNNISRDDCKISKISLDAAGDAQIHFLNGASVEIWVSRRGPGIRGHGMIYVYFGCRDAAISQCLNPAIPFTFNPGEVYVEPDLKSLDAVLKKIGAMSCE